MLWILSLIHGMQVFYEWCFEVAGFAGPVKHTYVWFVLILFFQVDCNKLVVINGFLCFSHICVSHVGFSEISICFAGASKHYKPRRILIAFLSDSFIVYTCKEFNLISCICRCGVITCWMALSQHLGIVIVPLRLCSLAAVHLLICFSKNLNCIMN